MPLKTLLPVLAIFLVPVSAVIAQKSSSQVLKKMLSPEGTLYFLNPEKFDGVNQKGRLIPDFTWLYKSGNTTPDSVTMNFFLITRSQSIKPANLVIKMEGKEIYSTSSIKLMFLEKNKKNWENRLSAQMPAETFLQMLRSASTFQISIFSPSGEMIFRPCKKWKKMAAIALPILEAETGVNR